MRFDAFISVRFARPINAKLRQSRAAFCGYRGGIPISKFKVPILMYHGVSDDEEPGTSPYYKLNTSPKVFKLQMRTLAENDYRVVNIAKLYQWLNESNGLPRENGRLVGLTFDDGLRDFRTHAAPVLAEYGFGATVYLPTAFIGTNARKELKGRECMTWSEVVELDSSGIEFGAHTVTHPVLASLSPMEANREIIQSKVEIEQKLGKSVTSFSFPYAFPYPRSGAGRFLTEAVKRAGYTCSVTTMLGRVGIPFDPFKMPRLPVNDCDDPDLFHAKLEGAYDWVASPQKMYKAAKTAAHWLSRRVARSKEELPMARSA